MDKEEEKKLLELLKRIETNPKFYKNSPKDTIYWVESTHIGEHLFTFDKKRIFNLFRDYPMELTKEQRDIFKKENPYWADFFKHRES